MLIATCCGSGGLAYYLYTSDKAREATLQDALRDAPALAAFAELADVNAQPVTADVGPTASVIRLREGALIQVPAGAFPDANQLQVTRVDVALDQIAPDVSGGAFYIVGTRDDVPVLGSPVILELPRPGADVTVVEHEGGAWRALQVEPGPTIRIEIGHFSKGIFGFFEWWSERDIELGETIDSMDSQSPEARMRLSIEGGDKMVHSFFGVNEQATQTDTEMCEEITSLLRQYNTPRNRRFPSNAGSSKDLADFLFAGSAPSQMGGRFSDLTEDSMEEIHDKLMDGDAQISPAEFLKISIDANKGNIPLGVLAAHNYLKNITYKGRTAYSPKSGMPEEYGGPASRLRSWRQGTNITPAGEYDKMGPLYHIFAAMTGALWLPTRASGPAIASGEAFLRTFRVGGDRPDTPKAAADQCGIDVAAWLRNHPPEAEEAPTETEQPAGPDTVPGQNEVYSGVFDHTTPWIHDSCSWGVTEQQDTVTITIHANGTVTGTGLVAYDCRQTEQSHDPRRYEMEFTGGRVTGGGRWEWAGEVSVRNASGAFVTREWGARIDKDEPGQPLDLHIDYDPSTYFSWAWATLAKQGN